MKQSLPDFYKTLRVDERETLFGRLLRSKSLRRSLSLPLIGIASIAAFSAEDIPHSSTPLEERFSLVLPDASEQEWKKVGWRTNLMEAREIAQKQNRPVFLWIMVGNPHGCT